MIYVLYESPSNVILPFMNKLRQQYPKSSRGYVGKKDKIGDLVPVYSKPPLFNRGWLIECSPKVSKGVIQKLDSFGFNLIVVRVTNKTTLTEVVERLNGLKLQVIDNYNLKKDEVLDWIEEELQCSVEVSGEIYDRCRGRLKAVVTAVGTLALLDNVTLKDVRKYVSRVNYLSVNDVGDFLIGAQRRGVSVEKVVDVIYEYRYAFPWLMKFLREHVKKYVVVLGYAATGDLTLVNYKDFQKISKDKVIQKLSEKQLKRMVGLLGTVPYEYAMFVLCQLNSINEKNRMNIYKLIQLVKLGG